MTSKQAWTNLERITLIISNRISERNWIAETWIGNSVKIAVTPFSDHYNRVVKIQKSLLLS